MIDINCDMAESYGRFRIGNDVSIMEYIDSCNIACGFHAGDPSTIDNTITLAIKLQKNIGAHPGYPDLAGFGRRSMQMNNRDFYAVMLYQIAAVKSITELKGGKLHHVKPHGALYHDLYENEEKASIFCDLMYEIQKDLILFTNPGSMVGQIAQARNIQVWEEAFADRRYAADLSLVSRSEPNSVISDPEEAAAQARMIGQEKMVVTQNGFTKSIHAETLCIHGDTVGAIDIAKAVRKVIS